MSDGALIPLKEAARQCGGVSVRTLEREERDGKITFTRIRSLRFVAPDELERYKIAAQCPFGEKATGGKSVSDSVLVAVSSVLYRQKRPAKTQGRSKLRSAARRSTLRLVGSPSA